METRVQTGNPGAWQARVAIVFAYEGEDLFSPESPVAKLFPWAQTSPPLGDFKGKKKEAVSLFAAPNANIPRIMLVGLGARDAARMEDLRDAMGHAVQKCRNLELNSILLPASIMGKAPGGTLRAIYECVYAAHLSLYRFTDLKTEKKEAATNPETLIVASETSIDNLETRVNLAVNAADATCFARDLDNMPGNLLYPETLALRAAAQAEELGLKIEILDETALDAAGMGCVLAVGAGSVHKPRLITLEYAAEGRENDKPLVLVGKGITFDSGGLCLKPAANMGQMKADMSGAAAVLAVIRALAKEKAPVRVAATLACAENMPDGKAYRPGDVLYSASGETVEVINTDAEGRLVLCDAITYAQKKYTPEALIDIATLTGACAVALGTKLAGLFCDDATLREKILALGAAAGENFWPLPLWRPYEDQLKSEIADIRHTASREGGAITAALFLRHFIKNNLPYAHLDIAGVDWNAKKTPLCPEGPTGFGTRVLLELARGGAR